jgi:hypothetical protein
MLPRAWLRCWGDRVEERVTVESEGCDCIGVFSWKEIEAAAPIESCGELRAGLPRRGPDLWDHGRLPCEADRGEPVIALPDRVARTPSDASLEIHGSPRPAHGDEMPAFGPVPLHPVAGPGADRDPITDIALDVADPVPRLPRDDAVGGRSRVVVEQAIARVRLEGVIDDRDQHVPTPRPAVP